MRARFSLGVSLALVAGGCTAIVGLDDVSYTNGAGGDGGAGATGATGATGTTGTTGGGASTSTSTSASSGGGGASTSTSASSGGGGTTTTSTTSTTSTSSTSSTGSGTTGTDPVQEGICNDNLDNDGDGDGDKDAADSDCALPPSFSGCAAGQKLHVYNAQDVPVNIPNDSSAGASSEVFVPGDVTIVRAAVVLGVTHPKDKDLTVQLSPPSGSTLELFSQVGGTGADFMSTVLDSMCDTSIGIGTAPFTGCYKPGTSFSTLAGKNAQGTWTLHLKDDSDPYAGTLQSWALVLCAQ